MKILSITILAWLASVAAADNAEAEMVNPWSNVDLHVAEDFSTEKLRIHNPNGYSFACPNPEHADALDAKYHADSTCDRVQFNEYKENVDRHLRHQYFVDNPEKHSLVPDQKTVVCPNVIQNLYSEEQETGYDTSWIVDNQATSPVVLAYVDPVTGQEVSAVDRTTTPAQMDPNSILQPGGWKHVHVFEGFVFHARELLPNGQVGRVLLQHRNGLIPVGERMANALSCTLDDPQPLLEVEKKLEEKVVVTITIDPAFQRTPRPYLRDCNMISVGFRNKAGCPIHGYFVRPSTCVEIFHFHLGLENIAKDFHWDWASPTKFEGSYVGNTFVFRLATHPDGRLASGDGQVVDKIEIKATTITDCPDLKQQVYASNVFMPQISLPVSQFQASNAADFGNATIPKLHIHQRQREAGPIKMETVARRNHLRAYESEEHIEVIKKREQKVE